jgi:hypothetical protein
MIARSSTSEMARGDRSLFRDPLQAQLRDIIEGHLRFYNGADVSLSSRH